MATITWNPTAGGAWSNTLDWIGGVVPGTADTALISASTSEPAGPSIAAGTSIAVGSVVMQGDAFLVLAGTLAPLEGVTLDGGQIEFQAGTLSGPIDFSGGALAIAEAGAPPGTLDAVTLAGSTDITGTFSVIGGMVVQSPTANLAGATFNFLGTQTLTGNLIDGLSLSSDGSLTIAAGTTLSDAGGTPIQPGSSFPPGTIVNDGVILAASISLGLDFVNNDAITLEGVPSAGSDPFDSVATFDNAGTLLLTGGATLSPFLSNANASFTNSGLIEIADGATLSPTYGLDAINPEIDNTGTISLDAGGVFQPLMKISGGTIRSDGGTISSGYGPVDDALIAGSVVVLGELGGDDMTFAPTADATIATITLAPHDAGDGGEIDDQGNLTFGAGTALAFDATSDIDTTPQTGFSLYGASLNLGGAIAALPGGSLVLQAESTNSLDEAAYGLFDNSGSIGTAAGETLIVSAGSLVNTGTIALVAGATLEFIPYATVAFIASIQNAGGAIEIDGTLDATGATETLSAGSVLSDVTFEGLNTVLLGGTFVMAGGVLPQVATLDATTWHGTLDLSAFASITLLGGITFAGSAGGAGTVLLPVDGVLNVGSDTTLSNADLMFGVPATGGATTETGQLIGDAGPLSIGTQATLQLAAPVAGYFAIGTTTLTNQGVISFGADNVGLVFSGGAIDSAMFSGLAAAFGPALQSVLTGASVSAAPTLTTSDVTGIEQDTAVIAGSGTLLVQAGGIAILDASVANTQAIEFGGAGGGLILTDPTGIAADIAGFGGADVIDLPLQEFSGGTPTYASGRVTIPSASGATELRVELAAGVSASRLQLREDPVGGTELYVACFAAGMRIATPCGAVAVEHLKVGDPVRTASGAVRPVVWIGHRRLAPRRHPRPHDVQPVRIEAGAFAPGVPNRDLRLSPDHAVFCDGVLIPVRYLLNGASIAQQDVASVTYWHVELASHDVLLAEALPCESFLDTGNRGAFAGEAPARVLHPTFARETWARDAFAPLVLAGPALTRARARLIARLPSLGHRMTEDPALRLFADGAECAPRRAGDWVRLLLPAARRTLRLRSRVGVPAHLDAASDDTRRLGVALAEMRLDGAPIALADPRFASGWHVLEPELRWTDGDAGIELAGARLVELRLARGLLRYCLGGSRSTRRTIARPGDRILLTRYFRPISA